MSQDAHILSFEEHVPRIHSSAFIAPGVSVIGNVEIGADSSVWFNTVVRGDVHWIRIGERTNIQDHSTLHVSSGKWPLAVGHDVTAGHNVILHGCTIEDRCLIGMGAIVMDGAVIESDVVIGAGSVVTPGTRIPSGHLALGQPAKVKRLLSDEERASLLESARHYAALAKRYRLGSYAA